MKKRIIGFILVLCFTAGFAATSVTVHAAGNNRAIQSGTNCIADGDILYFGTQGPRWEVLDADSSNTGTSGMFLISEGTMGFSEFETAYNSDDGDGQSKPNSWQGSDVQAWCTNNFGILLTAAEQAAILSVSKTDPAATLFSINWGESSLNNERMFILSAQEAATYLGDYNGAPGLLSNDPYWLRSPNTEYDFCAGLVHVNGDVGNMVHVMYGHCLRLATNLNLNSVIFTSAAGGESTSIGTISEIPSYTGNEWKVTLYDSNRSGFTAKTTANNAGVLTIEYSGAVSGNNNYVSAIIADSSGAFSHYGKLAEASASGSLKVDLSGINTSGKTLYIFNEQYNGKKTDLSSKLVEVDMTVANPYGVPSTGSHRDTGLMLTLTLLSGSVLLFSLRRRKEA